MNWVLVKHKQRRVMKELNASFKKHTKCSSKVTTCYEDVNLKNLSEISLTFSYFGRLVYFEATSNCLKEFVFMLFLELFMLVLKKIVKRVFGKGLRKNKQNDNRKTQMKVN